MSDTYRLSEDVDGTVIPASQAKKLSDRKRTPPVPPGEADVRTATVAEPQDTVPIRARLTSLDAYRGFIMLVLAAGGFGIARFVQLPEDAPAWQYADRDVWQAIAFHFNHPEWVSKFGLMGVSFWDLIQPAFMFMVGVAMPFSYANRKRRGQKWWTRTLHALWRAIALVLLGVFLYSMNKPQTNFIFTNVLAQIGLGYFFLYLLLGRHPAIQAVAFIAILAGSWWLYARYTPPENYDYEKVNATPETVFEGRFAPWSKNANAGHELDVEWLNRLPRPADDPHTHNRGGYLTINFLPSMATSLLGIWCGMLLLTRKPDWTKVGYLAGAAAVCMVAGLLLGEYVVPIVKRIWTPSWVLFSGAWVIAMLAVFYVLFDILPLKKLAFPLVVVGMNPLAVYLMGQLLRPWVIRVVDIHITPGLRSLTDARWYQDDMYGRLYEPIMAALVFWLIALWMYRKRIFLRV